jgi:hypothetical protein
MIGFLNDLMRALGGRKFLLAIFIVVTASYIEIHTTRGITPAFAGMMVSIIGLFNVTNTLASRDYLGSKQPDVKVVDHTEDLNSIKTAVVNSAQTVQNLHSFLTSLINAAKPGGSNGPNPTPNQSVPRV